MWRRTWLSGAMNPNGGHAMGAMRIDAYDDAFSGVTVNVTSNTIDHSPCEAFEIVSGSGNSGWSTTPVLTTFPRPGRPSAR